MNILFLTTHFNTGGITTYILTLSKQLVRFGNKVYVISSGGDRVDDLLRVGAAHITLDLKTKFFLSWKIFASVPGVRNVVREKKIAIIHAHTRVTHFLAYAVSLLTGVPYVITYHGFYRVKPARRMFPCLGEKVISISDQVTSHLIRDFYVPPERIATVRNGIDLDLFRPVSPDSRRLTREELSCHGKKVVGVIARLADVKGHRFLIDAIDMLRKRIPDVFLMVVGTGKEEKRLKDQVRRSGLEGYVKFFPVTNASVKFLEAFDCFVLPTLNEGLGLSVMEAQASGLPVVASRTGGILSLIENGKTGLLVSPGNAEELCEAIGRIFVDPDLARSLGAAALEQARREYGADIMAKNILSVYDEILGN